MFKLKSEFCPTRRSLRPQLESTACQWSTATSRHWQLEYQWHVPKTPGGNKYSITHDIVHTTTTATTTTTTTSGNSSMQLATDSAHCRTRLGGTLAVCLLGSVNHMIHRRLGDSNLTPTGRGGNVTRVSCHLATARGNLNHNLARTSKHLPHDIRSNNARDTSSIGKVRLRYNMDSSIQSLRRPAPRSFKFSASTPSTVWITNPVVLGY